MLELDAREALHLIELRSGREGHPSYRAVAHEMRREIAEVHPNVAAAMTFVDDSTEERLERLLSEMRNESRRRRAADVRREDAGAGEHPAAVSVRATLGKWREGTRSAVPSWRTGFNLFALIVSSTIALAIVAAAILFAGDVEPDAFAVRFENDLGQPVVLALCHSDQSARCEHPYYADSIGMRSAGLENISPGIRTEWAVLDMHGNLLRCVVLYWKHYPGGTQHVRLSGAPLWAWPCPRATPAL